MRHVRDCVPPPHGLLHALQFPKDNLQSLARQGWGLQERVTVGGFENALKDLKLGVFLTTAAQSLPPLATALVMRHVRDCVPPPHALLHAPQFPYDTSQSLGGQRCVLQERLSPPLLRSTSAQSLPP